MLCEKRKRRIDLHFLSISFIIIYLCNLLLLDDEVMFAFLSNFRGSSVLVQILFLYAYKVFDENPRRLAGEE